MTTITVQSKPSLENRIKNRLMYVCPCDMLLVFQSVGNSDFGQNPNAEFSPTHFKVVNNYEEASALCRLYIDHYDLGGGNWTGGQLYNSSGTLVASVSYNGRVWNGSYHTGNAAPIETDNTTISRYYQAGYNFDTR